MHDQELLKIIGELKVLPARFGSGHGGPTLDGTYRATYKRLVLEAKGILASGLGFGNEFSVPLLAIASPLQLRPPQRPTVADVQEAIGLIEGGLNSLRRHVSQSIPVAGVATVPYVAPVRLLELRRITVGQWDLTRLVRMIEELNIAYERGAYISTAMLVRAITDHVPPIFGQSSFQGVANSYPGGKSFGEHMKYLDNSLRKVADGLLHQQVRKTEVLPQGQQVDFRAPIDQLLAEVVRVLS